MDNLRVFAAHGSVEISPGKIYHGPVWFNPKNKNKYIVFKNEPIRVYWDRNGRWGIGEIEHVYPDDDNPDWLR